MENNNYANYLSYIKVGLGKINTESSISILDKINEIDSQTMGVDQIRFIVKSVESVNKIDGTRLPIYSEWFTFIR